LGRGVFAERKKTLHRNTVIFAINNEKKEIRKNTRKHWGGGGGNWPEFGCFAYQTKRKGGKMRMENPRSEIERGGKEA